MEVAGRITALSHIFYITPKTQFVQISQDDETWTVIIADKDQLAKLKDHLVMRSWVCMNHLKKVCLFKGTAHEVSLLAATTQTSVVEAPRGVARPLASELISYEGLVTSDKWGTSGFYQLDGSITLCLAYSKLVTNTPTVRQGDRLTLYHCHRVRTGGEVCLVLCGRGSVVNHSTRVASGLYPEAEPASVNDFLQDLALDRCCGFRLLHTLHRLSRDLCHSLDGLVDAQHITAKRTSDGRKGLLAKVVDHLLQQQSIPRPDGRSFSREFLFHHVGCTPAGQEDALNVELWPLDEDALVKRCTDAGLWQSNDAGASTSYWSDEMAAVSADADRLALLVGRLTFCGGEWWLRDGAGGVRCVVTEAAPGPPAAGVVVSAAHFVVHRETFRTEDTEDLVRVYVTLNADRVHVVRDDVPPVAASPLDRHLVQFLLLDKSPPQVVHLLEPVQRHAFGYLLHVSLFQAPPRERRDADDCPSALAAPPLSCILFCSGAAHVARYAQLVEGGVYQLGQRRDDLLEPRLTLACATQIPQTSLRRQVYGAAEWASLTPLAYELPKRWAYMSRDAVSVGECVDQADVGGVVALHGRVVERRHLEPLAGEGAAAACAAAAAAAPTPADATGLWLGLPANKKVMLKLSDAAVDGAPGRRLDVYVDVSGGRVYPAALTPGASVRLTWLHVRQTGRTHRLYCASTPLTRVGVLAAAEEAAAPPAGGAQAAGPRVLLGHLMPNSLGADLWTCLVSVRYIHKVSLMCRCCSCSSPVSGGVCSYVGCHSHGPTKLELKAWCTVEDGTGHALVYLTGDACRRWLKMPNGVWNTLQRHSLPHEGEFVYLSSRNRDPGHGDSLTFQILKLYLTRSSQLRRPLHLSVRQFRNNTEATAYFMKEHPWRRLFCVDAAEMDATLCATELCR